MPSTARKGMWIDEALELTMDAIENGTFSLWKANKAWNIPMSSISNHLNGKTRSKKIEPRCRDLSLGLATKAKACKGAGQEE
jgi:hypothetical protein